MKIYFSGVGGVGIGPLMEIASDAGYQVVGSDQAESLMTKRLIEKGLEVYIGQSYAQIEQVYQNAQFDWFVYSSALPADNPELVFAREHGIRTSKRDEFLSELLREKNLQLIAVAGTHGKTTTTGLLIWVFQQLGIPISYSVGTTLSFAESGHFDQNSKFFVYECDEFDRNMLHFEPDLSIITSLDYDHPDTYPTKKSYVDAFVQFVEQSGYSFMWGKDRRALDVPDIEASYEVYDELMDLSAYTLPGKHMRQNAYLVHRLLDKILDNPAGVLDKINAFPGTGRRFEKLTEGLYSDYGHHPIEIAATLQMAREMSDQVVLVYQPHQNIRQHEVRSQYTDEVFQNAHHIYWLPTYLSRENPDLEVLTPQQLTSALTNVSKLSFAKLDDDLWRNIQNEIAQGKLVLLMGAGSIDGWARKILQESLDSRY